MDNLLVVSQIDSVLANVTFISMDAIYTGDILTSDWVAGQDNYSFTVLKTTHQLTNPCVIKFDVNTGSVYENAFVEYQIDGSENITFYVDEPVLVKFKIQGDKV